MRRVCPPWVWLRGTRTGVPRPGTQGASGKNGRATIGLAFDPDSHRTYRPDGPTKALGPRVSRKEAGRTGPRSDSR